mgnify:CR=1 FL=1
MLQGVSRLMGSYGGGGRVSYPYLYERKPGELWITTMQGGLRMKVNAADLDSGDAVPFGQPGHDDVPISLAVQASAALPGLFAPVRVKGRTCVDGALKKTLHATVLLDEGLDLLICLNPLVPFDATHATRHKVLGSGEARLVMLGLLEILGEANPLTRQYRQELATVLF